MTISATLTVLLFKIVLNAALLKMSMIPECNFKVTQITGLNWPYTILCTKTKNKFLQQPK